MKARLEDSFEQKFETLTGFPPFAWQKRLYHDYFAKGQIPSALDIPTGLGKTSVMAIWYLTLNARTKLPRRLVYVVDRRTVVDQATTVADEIREKSQDSALPVSTLRVDDSQIPRHACLGLIEALAGSWGLLAQDARPARL